MPHYLVTFILDDSTERIDCCGLDHAETIYKAIKAHKKALRVQENGKIKTIRSE